MSEINAKVNTDLDQERRQCSFSVNELTNFLDGGSEKTKKRHEFESIILDKKELWEGVPDEYLSHKERYEVALKRACIVVDLIQKIYAKNGSMLLQDFRDMLSSMIAPAVLRDGSPLGVHLIMFVPTIIGQGSPDQQHWAARAWNCNIIGTYAQTELGHGTFIRGLETTATYDPSTKEFVLNSPTLTSYKWWPGGLGQTANYSIVVAQLYTKGKCHGIHPFLVQIRDEETHMPLPGIHVGEIGAKLGLNTVNNGFLGLKNVRIPREQMLMKNAQVLEDGTYVSSPSSKLTYGTMMFVRVVIVRDMCNYIAKATTIAIRYSAVRRQSQIRANSVEPQVMDFVTQQHKLYIGIATYYAYHQTAAWLWDIYEALNGRLAAGDLDRLPEVHALSCCLKAVCTADAAVVVERCRLACGGHGYMHSSNLPMIYGQVTAACTYEGDNTVLLLQAARFLMKAYRQASLGLPVPATVAYLAEAQTLANRPWDISVPAIVAGFQAVAAGKISSAARSLEARAAEGACAEDAWNLTSVQLVQAAEAHCRAILVSTFHSQSTLKLATVSPELRPVLTQLVDLYSVYWAIEKLGDLLRYTRICERDVERLQRWYEDLLGQLRPNAVGLVDAFDIRDEILHSTLGAWDGRVYERLMAEALKSPLNQEPVNSSYHLHLKPFMGAAKL